MRDARDVAVIGGGFGGTLVAMCLAEQGRDVVVLERETHPRFAIGESSTPLANWVLRDLAKRYGLDELDALTRYGSWKETYPELGVGPKRGFSFFAHRPGKPFAPQADRGNELLVAANRSQDEGDTQWLRSDVDAFFARCARARGVDVREGVEVTDVRRESGWTLTVRDIASAETSLIEAAYIIDASGGGSPIARTLHLSDEWSTLATRSRALFSHFEGVRPWTSVYEEGGGDSGPHPFPADAAALHHVLPEGWMWMLGFDNGVTSVGALLTSIEAGVAPDEEWSRVINRYPSIKKQMEGARATRPLTRTKLLQRRLRPAAGPDWVLLPAAAYFIDPFLSPGNAHTLFGIERIARAFEAFPNRAAVAGALESYDDALQREIDLLDALIHGSHSAFNSFSVLAAFTMYYFAGAICSEVRREKREAEPTDGFLLAHDETFRGLVHSAYADVLRLTSQGMVLPEDARAFAERVRVDIEPYNPAGLCDPSKQNLYPYV
jgi:tetracycline 7-halogenase / FADH2 O2-dependent halogenase